MGADVWHAQGDAERKVFLRRLVQRDQVRVETQITGDGEGYDVTRLLKGVKTILVTGADLRGAIGVITRNDDITQPGGVVMLLPPAHAVGWDASQDHTAASALMEVCKDIFREVAQEASDMTGVGAYSADTDLHADVRYVMGSTKHRGSPKDFEGVEDLPQAQKVQVLRYTLAALSDLAEYAQVQGGQWPSDSQLRGLKWMDVVRTEHPTNLRDLLLRRLKYMAQRMNPDPAGSPSPQKALLAQITGHAKSGPLLQGAAHQPARHTRKFRNSQSASRRRPYHDVGAERNARRRNAQANVDLQGVKLERTSISFEAKARQYVDPSGVGKPQLVTRDAAGGGAEDKKRKRAKKGHTKRSKKDEGKGSKKGRSKRSKKDEAGKRSKQGPSKHSKAVMAPADATTADAQLGEVGQGGAEATAGGAGAPKSRKMTAQKRVVRKCAKAPVDVLSEECPGWNDLSAERQAELLGKPAKLQQKQAAAHRGIWVMTTGVYTILPQRLLSLHTAQCTARLIFGRSGL